MLRIAFTSIILLSARCGNLSAETGPTCNASVQSLLPQFLVAGEPYKDNPLFSALSQCGPFSDIVILTRESDFEARAAILSRSPHGRWLKQHSCLELLRPANEASLAMEISRTDGRAVSTRQCQ